MAKNETTSLVVKDIAGAAMRWTALAAIIFLHIIVVVWWNFPGRHLRQHEDTSFYLSLIPIQKPPAQRAAPQVRRLRSLTQIRERIWRAPTPGLAKPDSTLSDGHAAQDKMEQPPTPTVTDPAHFDASSMLALAKSQAGAIDRELRHGKSGVPDDPDTPMSRFVRGVESAAIERSMAEQREHSVSADGTRYTTIRFQGKERCYMSGAVNNPHGKSQGPAEIECPGKKRTQTHARDGNYDMLLKRGSGTASGP